MIRDPFSSGWGEGGCGGRIGGPPYIGAGGLDCAVSCGKIRRAFNSQVTMPAIAASAARMSAHSVRRRVADPPPPNGGGPPYTGAGSSRSGAGRSSFGGGPPYITAGSTRIASGASSACRGPAYTGAADARSSSSTRHKASSRRRRRFSESLGDRGRRGSESGFTAAPQAESSYWPHQFIAFSRGTSKGFFEPCGSQ